VPASKKKTLLEISFSACVQKITGVKFVSGEKKGLEGVQAYSGEKWVLFKKESEIGGQQQRLRHLLREGKKT